MIVRRLIGAIAPPILALGLLAFAHAAEPPVVRPPLKLNAALIVPDQLMVGPGYKLDAVVRNDGFINTYTLNTDWGPLAAESDYRLRMRIQEVEALKTLDAMSRSGVFGDALKEGALSPVYGAKRLVESPVETTRGAVEGLGRWFGGIGRAVASDDPYQEGAVSAAAGWSATKRAYALELGVDPYTDWEPLEKALVDVARAAFAGSISAAVATEAALEGKSQTRDVVTVLGFTNDLNELLVDNPPELLTKRNRERLEEMGIDDTLVDAFLRNYNYSPMEKTLLVEALGRMSGSKGRGIFLAHATAAPEKGVAEYMQQRAEMMANYQSKHGATDIVDISGRPWQRTRNGKVVGVFPVDYMPWTPALADIMRKLNAALEKEKGVTGREIWLEGSASSGTRKALKAQGWVLKERVGLITGEKLQPEAVPDGAIVSSVGRGAGRVVR